MPAGVSSVEFQVKCGYWGAGQATISASLLTNSASANLVVTPVSGLAASGWPKYQASAGNGGFAGSGIASGEFIRLGTIGKGVRNLSLGTDGRVFGGADEQLAFPIRGGGAWRIDVPVAESTPAVGADGTVYAGSTDGHLYAITPGSGVRWKFKTGAPIHSSPAIGNDGTIYFGSDDGSFYALTPGGSRLWSFTVGAPVNSSAALGPDGSVYFTGSRDLFAFTHDGRLRWRARKQFGGEGAVFVGSPAISASDGGIRVADANGGLFSWTSDGVWSWPYPTAGKVEGSPALSPDGRTTYLGGQDGSLYAFTDQGQRWKTPIGRAIVVAPTVGPDGVVYVSDSSGVLKAVKPDGRLLWKASIESLSPPIIGDDGTMYVVDRSGALWHPRGRTQALYVVDPAGDLVAASTDLPISLETFESKDGKVAKTMEMSTRFNEASRPLATALPKGAKHETIEVSKFIEKNGGELPKLNFSFRRLLRG